MSLVEFAVCSSMLPSSCWPRLSQKSVVFSQLSRAEGKSSCLPACLACDMSRGLHPGHLTKPLCSTQGSRDSVKVAAATGQGLEQVVLTPALLVLLERTMRHTRV